MAELSLQDGIAGIGDSGVIVEWAVAGASAPGESRSGDRHLVREFDDGVLIVVVDALGHGREAARVAETAVDAIQSAGRESLSATFSRCHRALMQTRGAVAAAAWLSAAAEMRWLAVGNATAVLIRRRYGQMQVVATLTPQPGVIGMRMPDLHEQSVGLRPADLLLIATDGIEPDFQVGVDPSFDLATQTAALFQQHRIAADDGLLLAARYQGRSSG